MQWYDECMIYNIYDMQWYDEPLNLWKDNVNLGQLVNKWLLSENNLDN